MTGNSQGITSCVLLAGRHYKASRCAMTESDASVDHHLHKMFPTLTMAMAVTLSLVAGSSLLDAGSELGDAAFKKYAMMKIFEDCYGKLTVRDMFQEVTQACARCRSMEPSPMMGSDAMMAMEKPKKPARKPVTVFYPVGSQNPAWAQPPYIPFKPNFFYYSMPQPNYYPYRPLAAMPPSSSPIVKREVVEDEEPAPSSVPSMTDKVMQLVTKLQNKISNITCVMQELGFLDEEKQPSYDSIKERIEALPVSDEMKTDLLEGVDTCRDFSMCLPPNKLNKMPMFQELAKPVVFFNCFKGKKLAACMKKDLRQMYGNDVDEGIAMAREFATNAQSGQTAEADPASIFSMIYGFDVGNMPANNFF